MMEKEYEVKTFLVELICDECESKMITDGTVLMTNPPKYKYQCINCNHSIVTTTSYPYYKHQKVQ